MDFWSMIKRSRWRIAAAVPFRENCFCDGFKSLDFAPLSARVNQSNWSEKARFGGARPLTIPGCGEATKKSERACQSMVTYFRLYDPLEPHYDPSWAMLDIEQVK